jgi:acetyltransferase
VIATDVLVKAGLEIPPLSEGAEEVLKERLFPEAAVGNPTDVLATATPEHFRAAMDVMMDEEQIDSLFINFVTPFYVDTEGIAKEIAEVSKQRRKPIVCNLMTNRREWTEVVRILKDGEVPNYALPTAAAGALAAMAQYNEIRSRDMGEARTFHDVDKARAEALLRKAKEAGREFLSAAEAYGILAAYGIPAADWRIAHSAAEAEHAAAEIGFPVVVKADSESIVHKSDSGGVAVNLQDSSAVRSAVDGMGKRFQAEDLSFFVQKYVPGGREVIVGAKAEKGLGHLVMFGMGGIYVEILKDVVFKIAPVTTVEAREMLSSLKMTPLLEGVRGEAGVDEEALVEIIERLSQLVTDLPMIQELDLNPVVAFEDRALVVDTRVGI